MTHDHSMGQATRAFVLHPVIRGVSSASRTAQAALEEAIALTEAIDLRVVGSMIVALNKPQPNTLVGSGTVETLAQKTAAERIDLIVVDHSLSPGQQRNLEKACQTKVIDRTGLILEIFGQRARTREGQLQVELAALTYQRSRLVRSWTHLERQRGGFGFLGGPGESQLEIDRRLIDGRIVRIKKDLQDVRRTRGLQRASRQRVPFPVVALVGYTNAGKSTLFNTMTQATVEAKDQLFATLDPTMRAIPLLAGRKVILSDTVGFVSNLPTMLVEAFRATLEEVHAADMILHVRDLAHPDTEPQKQDVCAVLEDMGIDAATDPRLMEVWNKADLLSPEEHERLSNQAAFSGGRIVLLSALTGEGIDRLYRAVDTLLSSKRIEITVKVDVSDGATLAWIYERGKVLDRQDTEEVCILRVSLSPEDVGRLNKRLH